MIRVYGFFVTRVYVFRDSWAIQLEQSHREQQGGDRLETRAIQIEQSCRAASVAVDRLETRLDRLECQVLVQLANSNEAQKGTMRTFADTVAAENTRMERNIGAQISQAGQVMTSALDTLSSNLEAVSAHSKRLFAELAAVTFRTTQVEALLRTRLAKQSPSVAESFLRASEEELLRVAESLAVLRPLVPYPEWRFDADWYNPDLCVQLRRCLWEHFAERDGEETVILPWHLGTRLCMHLNNDLSRQIFIAGCTEPNEFTFVDRFLTPGMTFVDVGANEGVYSIFAARRVGPNGLVWAFEPSERELARLRRNMEYNALNLRIFAAGLSDSGRHADLNVAESRYAGLNTMGKIPYEGVHIARTETVQLLRLDDVVSNDALSRLDLIKIDIEGGELAMLRGAVETLRRYRPVVIFELLRPALASQNASPEEVIEFLQMQGYALYQFDPSTGFPVPAKAMEYNDVGWSSFGIGENMIGVPQEVSLPAAVFSYKPADGRE